MEILIGILIVVLVLVLINIVTLNVKFDLAKHNNSNSSIDPNDPRSHLEFRAGVNHAFSLVQIALYKMWKDNEILDFDNINMDIKNNLNEITSDNSKLQKWNHEFVEYMKNKENEDDDN